MNRYVVIASVLGTLCACESGARKESPGRASAERPAPGDLAPLRPALEAAPAPAGGSADATPVTIGFEWNPPCRVPAIQDVEKKGARARLAFDVVLERGTTGLVLKLDNMRPISAPGDAQQGLERAMATLDGVVPPIAVSDSGESLGAIDIDKSIEATLALVRQAGGRTSVGMLEKMMKTPQFKEAMKQKAGETWDGWVGTWTGMTIAPHSERRETFDLPSVVGTFTDVPLTLKHHGAVRDAPTLALLSAEQVIEGPELAAALGGLVQDMANRAGANKAQVEFRHAKKVDLITVAMDTARGRPHRSRHEMTIELEGDRRKQVRDTAFDWSRAVGCGDAAKPAESDSADPRAGTP